MISRPIVTIAILVAATSAWADHGGGLSIRGVNPVGAALLWAGATFLAGIAVIAVVTLWSRRRAPRSPDA